MNCNTDNKFIPKYTIQDSYLLHLFDNSNNFLNNIKNQTNMNDKNVDFNLLEKKLKRSDDDFNSRDFNLEKKN